MPSCRRDASSAARWAASPGAPHGRAPGVGSGGRRGDARQQLLQSVDALLVLVEHVRQVRLRRLVGDRVDGTPGGQRRDRHLGHQRQCLVPVQRARQQVRRLHQEAQGTAAQPLQLAQPGRLDGQGDPVGGELQSQGLLVRVTARRLGRHSQGARQPALHLEGDRHDRTHARAVQQRDRARYRQQVLVHGRHAGRGVPAGPRLHGDACEALAGGGEPGGGAHLQFRLVVRRQEQERRVPVEHVAGALHRALEEAVQVVRGGGADEHLERVRRAPLARRFAARRAGRGLQDGALVVAHQQAHRRRFTVRVADPQVGGVHGDHAAVCAADAVAALPAGQLQGLRQARARARGVGPGGEVAELLADGLVGGVPEEVFRVAVPGGDGARAVDLDDRDPDALVGDGQQVGGEGGARVAGADRAFREVQLEPDVLVGGGVLHSPAGGQGGAQEQSAAVLPVRCRGGPAGALQGHLALRVAVRDLDPYAVFRAQAQDVRRRAGVDHRVGDEFAGQDDGVVDDVGVPPALQGVPDEGAGGRDRPRHGFEGGSRPRGDHRTPRTRLDARLRHGRPRPSRYPLVVRPHRPRRADRGGWTAGCQVTYLRSPGGRSRLFPSPAGGDVMRSCRSRYGPARSRWKTGRASGVSRREGRGRRDARTRARGTRSTPAGGTRWSLAWRRGAVARARRADGPGAVGPSRWTRPHWSGCWGL